MNELDELSENEYPFESGKLDSKLIDKFYNYNNGIYRLINYVLDCLIEELINLSFIYQYQCRVYFIY